MVTNRVIKVENGQPVGYPLDLNNFLHSFPEVVEPTAEQLSGVGYAFVENDSPPSSPYYKSVTLAGYTLQPDGVWTYDWSIEEMTDEEKQSADQLQKEKLLRIIGSIRNKSWEHIGNESDPKNAEWLDYWSNVYQIQEDIYSGTITDFFNVELPAEPQ